MMLLAVGITTNAQTSKESANARILSEFSDQLNSSDIYVYSTELGANDSIFLEDGTHIVHPFQSAWCYFIDEVPSAGWSHPCKYFIVDRNSNRHVMLNKDTYPANYDDYELVSRHEVNVSPAWNGVYDRNYNAENQAEPNKNQWALLITSFGGEDPKRFWGDLSCVYTTLTSRFGFIENQQNASETNEYFNHIVVVAPEGVSCKGSDLNNSGGISDQDFFSSNTYYLLGDDFYPYYNQSKDDLYTKNTIKLILDNFAGKDTTLYKFGYRALDTLDNLFVYVTGHGKYEAPNSYINVLDENNNTRRLYDYELSDWVKDIDCSQMTFVFQPCHSGGFVDDLMNLTDVKCKNRAVYTAADTEGISHSEGYINSVISPNFEGRDPTDSYWCDEFTFYWSAALLGYYPIIRFNQEPKIGPWDVFENNKIGSFPWELFFDETESLNHDEYDVSPDTNNDGVVSLDEAFVFTRRLDTWDRMGYYNPCSYCIDGNVEIPQSGYESSFSKEFITLDGYKGTNRDTDISTACTSRYFLSDDITLKTGTMLTINDNTTIYGNGNTLTSFGSVQTANDNNNSNLHNLKIDSRGENFVINNCNFIDSEKILVTNGIVDISNSSFRGTMLEIGRVSALPVSTVRSATITGNDFSQSIYGIIINSSYNVRVEDNNIRTRTAGLYLNNCYGEFLDISSSNRKAAVISDNNIQGCDIGLCLYNSNAYIINNKIHDNGDGISLQNLSNAVITGNSLAEFPNQTQEIKNNTNYQIITSLNSFPQKIQYNCISNNVNNNYLIHSTGNDAESMVLNVSHNCWKPLDDNSIASKLYTTGEYYYEYLPVWNPSSQTDTATVNPNPPLRMLESSDSLIGIGRYNDAYNVLVDIVDYYPNTNEAIVAMKSMLYLRHYTDNDYEALKNYYRTNLVILANTNLAALGDNLANKCDEILRNYEDAIEWYESVIENENASYEDRVFATIDLGNLYLKMQEEGRKSVGVLSEYMPKSAEQHAKTTAYLLSTLPGDDIVNKKSNDMIGITNQLCTVASISDDNVIVYLKEGYADMKLYNTLGVTVKEARLTEGENIIDVNGLNAGVYVWKAFSENNVVNTGKFIKK